MHHIEQFRVIALIRACDAPEDRLALALAYLHALRVSELVRLRASDFKDGYIKIHGLKSGETAVQALITHPNPALNEVQMLSEHINRHRLSGEDYLFPNRYPSRESTNKHGHVSRQTMWRLVQKLHAQAGIPEHQAHPHTLRHSCAMQMLEKGGENSLNKVQRYLRHKNISSTGVYIKVNDQTASQAAIKAFGGKQ